MITVLRPGMLSTVQDLGRSGWRRFGVPQSGAADQDSLLTANVLLGNPEGAPGLELTLGGSELLFETEIRLALVGADLGAQFVREGQVESAPLGRPLQVRAGTRLQTGQARSGIRLYLAVTGGVGAAPVLGSASTYLPARFGGFKGRALVRGDQIILGEAGLDPETAWRPSPRGTYQTLLWGLSPFAHSRSGSPQPLRATGGPEHDSFSAEALAAFWTGPFRVTPQADRMGLRLAGPANLARQHGPELLSSAVFPGTVQVPPSGEPIVLLADGQTVGGYPRIAQVTQVDLPRLAQLAPGEVVRFTRISPQAARELYQTRDAERRALKCATALHRSRGVL